MQNFSAKEWVGYDHEIVEDIRSSDDERYEAGANKYVRAYSTRLQRFLRRYTLQDSIAEDVAQEAFLTAIQKIRAGQFQAVPERSSWSWLVTIGANKARTWARSSRRTEERGRVWQEHFVETAPALEILIMERERFYRALARLPPSQRAAIRSQILVGLGTAKDLPNDRAHLCKALKSLNQLFHEEGSNDVLPSSR
jgi:DNA-directed RNA polymerase specialized sigma24 family protein